MNFTVLPPEVNSARMYAGAGPASMLAAATAWEGLAADLQESAAAFESVACNLAGSWQGAASEAMTTASAPYLAWLRAAAEHAGQTAAQAQIAAGSFEAALGATVHPAMVTLNRTSFASLIASNVLGQNAPAIAAAEADYELMWARDVAALSGYHADASAAVSQLLPWQQLMGMLPIGGGATVAAGVGGWADAVGSTSTALAPGTALVMGTAFLEPTPSYLSAIDQLFIAPFHPGYLARALHTPQQYWPLTGLTSLTFGQSLVQSAQALNSAIMGQNGSPTLVFGYSQGASVATLEMQHLLTLPVDQRPSLDQLSFVLAANPNRPDGGFLQRFQGLYIPVLDLPFFGATPANAYPTTDYAVQYDFQADFPRYPINLLADANALAGQFYIHSSYPSLTPAQIASGVVQPVSSADTLTKYILIPTHNLPLLEPLRAIPVVGNPLADLVQPDLRVLVELGYDRAAYQDVPTRAGLFPSFDPGTVAAELGQGAVQGFSDALADLASQPLPFVGLPRMW
ncbi:MAG: PPE family protein [Mycobacteriaceae bacterium]|nr:PPE family protein [Mycobacteriaceae bacterium]